MDGVTRRGFAFGGAALFAAAGIYAHLSALKGGETLKIPSASL